MRKKTNTRNFGIDIWNTTFGINLLKDSDGDGKPNWIDCRPYNRYKQDEDDSSILNKRKGLTREEKMEYRDNLRKMAHHLRYSNNPKEEEYRRKFEKKAQELDDELYE